MYAEVYLPIAVNQPFSYLIPQDLEKTIKVGALVRLPFANRFSIGYINKICDDKQYAGEIKSIDSIVSTIITDNPDIQYLIDWMQRYYLTPKGLVVKNIFSFLFKKNHTNAKTEKEILITKKGRNDLALNQIKGIGRQRILEHLAPENNFIKLKHL